jgi:hypothetical protein
MLVAVRLGAVTLEPPFNFVQTLDARTRDGLGAILAGVARKIGAGSPAPSPAEPADWMRGYGEAPRRAMSWRRRLMRELPGLAHGRGRCRRGAGGGALGRGLGPRGGWRSPLSAPG